MQAYKVVRRLDDKLYSGLISKLCPHDDLSIGKAVEYKLNTEVHPLEGCGPLCLFDTFESAEEYYYAFDVKYDKEIYLVEYTPSDKKHLWCKDSEPVRVTEAISDMADSVILADSVKLLELVKS